MTTDAVLTIDPATQLYDINLDENGDIATDDFFDTSILYSLFGERRASPDEVVDADRRRGWIGNEDEDFENGSKLWLLEQSRLTASNLSRIEDEAKKALQWLVDDGFAVAIEDVTTSLGRGKILLSVTIRRSRDKVDKRLFELWQNTGIR